MKFFTTSFLSLAVLMTVLACRQQPAVSNPSVPTVTPAPTPYQLSGAGVQFDVPPSWTASKASPDTVVLTSPDNELSVSFTETVGKDQKITQLLNAFNKDHRGVKKGGARQGTFNGLPHTSQSGEATNTVTNKTFEWSIDTLTAKAPLVIYSQVNRDAKANYQQDYEKIINSIRPLQ
jgi:hypothetical protein